MTIEGPEAPRSVVSDPEFDVVRDTVIEKLVIRDEGFLDTTDMKRGDSEFEEQRPVPCFVMNKQHVRRARNAETLLGEQQRIDVLASGAMTARKFEKRLDSRRPVVPGPKKFRNSEVPVGDPQNPTDLELAVEDFLIPAAQFHPTAEQLDGGIRFALVLKGLGEIEDGSGIIGMLDQRVLKQ